MSKKPLPPLSLDYGSTVFYRGKRHTIRQESQDFESVLLYDPETSKSVQARIVDLSPAEALRPAPQRDLNDQDREALEEAERKYAIIKPLLDNPNYGRADVDACAEKNGVYYTTIYRWLRTFETTGKVTAFIRQPRTDKGNKMLPADAEKVVSDMVESLYLTKQQRTPAKIIREVEKVCRKLGIKPPHANTIRNRLKAIDAYRKTKARRGSKAARDAFAQKKGSFPGADAPLSVVQIDHTPLDIVVVDEVYREAIGRPWLTLLIDVFSRVVLGFYISLDPPSNMSVGLCLAHAFLPKEEWLAKHDIETPWPCWGVPRTIHADNAKEFRGNMLKKACHDYGVGLEWRPVATPHYGAHIERLLGTLNDEIHALPGTTFSNPDARGEYDSNAQAVMTLKEVERWFAILCVEVYHQRKHSELGMPPIAKWQEGIFGTKKTPGIGVPARITDELRLKLDLMPFETRTVQHYGIVWDHIEYQHDVLRRWINAEDPKNPKLKRKFLCRRDPRDISVIWFYDPELEEYFAIPYRNISRPAISLWELRAAERRAAEEHPDVPIDEDLIFAAYDKMRSIEDNAKKLTRKARRNQERRRLGMDNAREHVAAVKPAVEPPPAPPSEPRRDIRPFDDFDDMQDDGDD